MSMTGTTHHRSPRQGQIDCSRQWLMEAYSKLMGKMPDEKITISAICAQAGVGRQTFYRHFHNKKDVILYQLDKGYEIFRDRIRKLPPESLTNHTLILEAFEVWKEQQTILNPLIQSSELSGWFMHQFILTWRKIAAEFFPPSNFQQYDIEFQIAGIAGVFLHWLQRGMKESPEEVAQSIVSQLGNSPLTPSR